MAKPSKSKSKYKDPYAEREAKRYENPIPSRELIMTVLKERGDPATKEQLLQVLKITKTKQKEAFIKRLQAMERDGQLKRTRKKEYGLVSKMNLIPGRVIGHRDGYGFVVPDDASGDLYLPAKYMRALFDGDRVLVRIRSVDKRGRREATLVQVIECNTNQVVGRLVEEEGVSFVVPEHKRISQDIIIPKDERGGAKPGQIVTVSIIAQPSLFKRAVGRVIEVLGDKRDPGMEVDIAIRAYGLPHEFSDDVIREAGRYKEFKSGKTYKDREDIRQLPLVTIDGEDAKDFDDAVYVERREKGGFRLLVAIADVSFYVKPGSTLDIEAEQRGNSVYFPDFVIPMLPEVLSNGLCSLNPDVDRFCVVCDMIISPRGEISRYAFYRAVMRSKARLTYTQVANALSGDKTIRKKMGSLYAHLESFHALYQLLIHRRKARGALDFDTVETKVLFDKNRKIREIVPVVRNDAHKMIEEAMLSANVCAAKFLKKKNMPSLFRVHEGPNEEKLKDVRDFLKEFNLGLRGGNDPQPKDYAEILDQLNGRPDAHIIQTVLLRSLKQAIYSPKNLGHFGLAYSSYTHFTSPIRRYPDLIIHRQICHLLSSTKQSEIDDRNLQSIGEHCSFTERRADEATRDALDALKCEFVSDRVGEIFTGIVTGVTGFGLFVELENLYVEGLIHISTLPSDYYRFDPIKHRLSGERSGLHLRLGDSIRVKVVRVDIEEKRIDLVLVETKKSGKKKKSRK